MNVLIKQMLFVGFYLLNIEMNVKFAWQLLVLSLDFNILIYLGHPFLSWV